MITAKDIEALIKSKMEDMTIPYLVLEWVKKNQGKKLRKNNLPEEGMSIQQSCNFTILTTKNYYYSENRGFRFFLSEDTKNVIIPTPEEFINMNAREYAGAEERNVNRQAILDSSETMENIANKLNEIYEAINHIKNATSEIECYQDYLSILELNEKRAEAEIMKRGRHEATK